MKIVHLVQVGGLGIVLWLAGGPVGCATYVNGTHEEKEWQYRKGSLLELVVTVDGSTEAAEAGPPVIGSWTGDGTFMLPPRYSRRYYALEIRQDEAVGRARRVEVGSVEELEGLPQEGHEFDERVVTLRLRRDAGALIFEGEKVGKHAEGRVRFEKDDAFEALAAGTIGRDPTPAELASMAFAGVRREDIDELRSSGRQLTVEQVVRLQDRGMRGDYIRDMRDTGRDFSLDDMVTLRKAGVDAAYVKGLSESGLDPTPEEIVRLRDNDVGPVFVRELRGPTGELPPLDEIVRLRNSGVSAKYVSELRGAGYTFATADIIRLNNSNVSSVYAAGIREAGYDLTPDELIRLRQSGASVQYVRDLQEPGYERLSIEQIMKAQKEGLSAEFVKTLRRKG